MNFIPVTKMEWIKPFLFVCGVVLFAILAMWLLLYPLANRLTEQIKRLEEILLPISNMYALLNKYILNPSQNLREELMKAISDVQKAFAYLSNPEVALKIASILQDKIRLGFDLAKEGVQEAQEKLNQELAKLIANFKNGDEKLEAELLATLNRIDIMLSKAATAAEIQVSVQHYIQLIIQALSVSK